MLFRTVHEFVQNREFSRRSARFVNSALGPPLFSDFHERPWVLQKSIFSPRSARFVIFALSTQLFSNFQESARVCTKHQHVLSFWQWVHYFLAIFSKLDEFVQNSVFSLDQPVLSFPHLHCHFWTVIFRLKQRFEPEIRTFSHLRHLAHHFLAVSSKVHEFVQNRRVQPEISKFCHFRTGHTTF